MEARSYLEFSIGTLRGHRLRSVLSTLGVAIGIAAVILLTSIGEGTRRFLLSEFAQFGTNILEIAPGKTRIGWIGTGVMGQSMAGHLLADGYTVHVHTRTKSRADGLVANGAVQRGMNGFAGEFGHMVVDPDGPRCPCGRRGCWERYASGSGLAMLAREAATGRRLGRVVQAAGGDPQTVRGEHVQAAARDGDPEALAVIDEFAKWVALGLSNLTNAFDPEMFVLGGGLAAGADLYLDPITKWYRELLYQPHLRPLPRVEFAHFGPLAGAVGAAIGAGAVATKKLGDLESDKEQS